MSGAPTGEDATRAPGPQTGAHVPPGQPMVYPALAAPGSYPPPPGAPGQYPPPPYHPSAALPYIPNPNAPPPGQIPPPGQNLPQYPTPGQYPPYAVYGYIVGAQGEDAVDSDEDYDYLRTRASTHPINIEFANKSKQKVIIYWLNEKGKYKKMTTLKNGQTADIDTFESHPFYADGTKDDDVVIDGNVTFIPEKTSSGHVKVDITKQPDDKNLFSAPSGVPVRVKFSNRANVCASIKLIHPNGHSQTVKDLAPRKAWLYTSHSGQYFIACQTGREREILELNGGPFYLVNPGSGPQSVKKVLLTECEDNSSSSCFNSSSDSD